MSFDSVLEHTAPHGGLEDPEYYLLRFIFSQPCELSDFLALTKSQANAN